MPTRTRSAIRLLPGAVRSRITLLSRQTALPGIQMVAMLKCSPTPMATSQPPLLSRLVSSWCIGSIAGAESSPYRSFGSSSWACRPRAQGPREQKLVVEYCAETGLCQHGDRDADRQLNEAFGAPHHLSGWSFHRFWY